MNQHNKEYGDSSVDTWLSSEDLMEEFFGAIMIVMNGEDFSILQDSYDRLYSIRKNMKWLYDKPTKYELMFELRTGFFMKYVKWVDIGKIPKPDYAEFADRLDETLGKIKIA